MRTRSSLAIAVPLALAACGGPAPAPTVAPPPVPPPIELELAWQDAEGVPAVAGGLLEVTAWAGGFLAVGIAGGPADDGDGILLRSDDGLAWREAAPAQRLAGLSLVDVAASERGLVAVGTRWVTDTEIASAILVSVDGTSWRLLEPAAYANADAYLAWVAAGPDGFLAGGGLVDPPHDDVVLASPDGQVWSVASRAPGVGEAAWDGTRWLAGGSGGERATVFTSADGATWAGTRLDGVSADGMVPLVAGDVVAVGTGAVAVVSEAATGCGFGFFGNSCPGMTTGWWSPDLATWGRQAADGPFGGPVELAVADGLVVAAHGSGLSASRDGWTWEELLAGPLPVGSEAGMAAREGTIVVVGTGEFGGPAIRVAVPAGGSS